jgi:hypothetical protein
MSSDGNNDSKNQTVPFVPAERHVILFIDPNSMYNDEWIGSPTDLLLFKGQRKRKIMDCYFNRQNTFFYVFNKSSRYGWTFSGKAQVIKQVVARTREAPPVWLLKMFHTHVDSESRNILSRIHSYHQANEPHTKYLKKHELYQVLQCKPCLRTIQTGIVPVRRP